MGVPRSRQHFSQPSGEVAKLFPFYKWQQRYRVTAVWILKDVSMTRFHIGINRNLNPGPPGPTQMPKCWSSPGMGSWSTASSKRWHSHTPKALMGHYNPSLLIWREPVHGLPSAGKDSGAAAPPAPAQLDITCLMQVLQILPTSMTFFFFFSL